MVLNKEFNCTLILTACIKPVDIPFLERKSETERLEDYKKTFIKWCENKLINKIIFIDNSGYDLSFFNDKSKSFENKKIEILSTNLNNTFDKKLGKGYGEYLCLKEIQNQSHLFRESDYFIKVTGRYYIKNYANFFNEFIKKRSDIFVCMKDNLTYADSHVFAGTKHFFSNYLISSISKINDTKGIFMEHQLSKSVLLGVCDDLKFDHFTIYPDVSGIIGTNNKKFKNNFFKKIKLYFFGKMKDYFLKHKKY